MFVARNRGRWSAAMAVRFWPQFSLAMGKFICSSASGNSISSCFMHETGTTKNMEALIAATSGGPRPSLTAQATELKAEALLFVFVLGNFRVYANTRGAGTEREKKGRGREKVREEPERAAAAAYCTTGRMCNFSFTQQCK